MAKKESTPPVVCTHCRTCHNAGAEVYELIYKCKIDGEPHHSVVNCVNINKHEKRK